MWCFKNGLFWRNRISIIAKLIISIMNLFWHISEGGGGGVVVVPTHLPYRVWVCNVVLNTPLSPFTHPLHALPHPPLPPTAIQPSVVLTLVLEAWPLIVPRPRVIVWFWHALHSIVMSFMSQHSYDYTTHQQVESVVVINSRSILTFHIGVYVTGSLVWSTFMYLLKMSSFNYWHVE